MRVRHEAGIPFFFGGPNRQLYGFYHSPIGQSVKSSPILICYPLGAEYDQSHHIVHQLAKQLAKSGFPVLRFNYFGTGNSGGEAKEVTFAGLLKDTSAAAAEVCERSQSANLIVIGIRSGATVAAGLPAVADKVVPQKLVLWDGFLEGRRRLTGRPSDWLRRSGFSRSFVNELRRRTPYEECALANRGPTLVLQSDGEIEGHTFKNVFANLRSSLEFKAFPEVSFASKSHAAAYKVINYIVQWVAN